MIKAQIVADSINEFGNRLTTMVVTFPRIILAEFNTHRMFSRNSASSRAIPFEKMIEQIKKNPFIPIAWQANHKGMQGTEYLNDRDIEVCISAWKMSSIRAIEQAEYLATRGATKQLINRLLEPFMWTTVIVSATEWENFFSLRCPDYQFTPEGDTAVFSNRSKKDYIERWNDNCNPKFDENIYNDKSWLLINKGQAEIHMMALAETMWDVYNESTPKELKAGEWHIPFGNDIDEEELESIVGYNMDGSDAGEDEFKEEVEKSKIKIAIARCARVSYTTLGNEKVRDYQDDIKLYDKLFENHHGTPLEHCARAMDENEYDNYSFTFPKYIQSSYSPSEPDGQDAQLGRCDNFVGFIQARRIFSYDEYLEV